MRADHGPIRRAPVGLAFLLTSVTLMAMGQLCMRRGMQGVGPIESFSGFRDLVVLGLTTPGALGYVWLGMAVYTLAILLWLQVLSRMDLSIAFPCMSLSYIGVYAGAALWPALDESLGSQRLIGTGLIMLGVALVAGSRRRRD